MLSTTVATIEHIKPQSRGGGDFLSNYLLVSAEYNNNRQSSSLNEYIELHPELDIIRSLQRYMDLVINEINKKNSVWSDNAHYACDIAKTIERETIGKIRLDVSRLSIPNKKAHETEIVSTNLSKKYLVKKR